MNDRMDRMHLEPDRGVSRWLVSTSVLYVVGGIVMMIWPHLTLELMGLVLGIGMLVVGLAHIILYMTKDHLNGLFQMDLTIGVVIAAFGAFMLLHQDFVSMAIPFGVGILMLVGGISHIQYSLDMRRMRFKRWNIVLFFALILIILGILLIYNPFGGNVLIYFIGISLILNGMLSIISILLITHRFKQIRAGKFEHDHMLHEHEHVVHEQAAKEEVIVIPNKEDK